MVAKAAKVKTATSRTALDRPRYVSNAGFTLFELLVVVAIAAIAIAIVGPVVGPGTRSGLTTTVRDLGAALREARNVAIATNRVVVVEIDAASGTLRYVGIAGPVVRRLGAAVSLTAPGGGAAIVTPRLWFSPDGSATGMTIAIVRGADRMVVDVESLTGRIRVAL